MSNKKQETIADILAEMRDFANRQEKNDCYDLREMGTDSLRAYADRIEVAERRETARLRAALKPVLDIVIDIATSDLSMELAIMECKRIYNEK